ncbi:MAG: 3-oxoacyl-[acyl-carrier-protein] synthase III C-terminal domain-containing protein, partial [Desulfocurvibacter africanus]
TADTYSRHVHPGDKSVRTLFGDGAAATLIEASGVSADSAEEALGSIGQMVYGTDGAGYKNLLIASGGARLPRCAETARECTDKFGNTRSQDHLFMDGPEIFKFTMQVVPVCVNETLARNNLAMSDVDLFVFHQANAYMLEGLREKIGIPEERFYVNMADCGNTVSATIPIALRRAVDDGRLKPGMHVMLVGYGVGYSWAGTVLQWA